MTKARRRILRELAATGLPYRMEPGGKHWKCFLSDRLVCVLSRGSRAEGGPRDMLNLIATIRRAARPAPK